ncbi:MAG: hypothetical protein WEC84_01430, partial [Candidatus Andersenbacteria bacterium]
FLTPIHLLLRFIGVSPFNVLQVSVVSYFLLGLLGMYTFFRMRAFSQAPAALGAALFTFSGFAIGHLNHVNFYTSTMLLPWLLIAAYALLRKPTLLNSALLALVAAATVVSGQPQIVMFVFVAVAVIAGALAIEHYSVDFKKKQKQLFQTIGLTILAGVISFMLSTFAILPLYEFLPLTERSDELPLMERLEFSYPPFHAITLILPYFFGDHETYWGPKGFQELAAFTGLIPLFLAGAALVRWKKYRPERIVGISFVALAIAMALGRHSVIYGYFSNQPFLTSLGVIGRFVFFFNLGMMLLAACALEDLPHIRKHKWTLLLSIGAGVALLVGILFPFFIQLQADVDIYKRFTSIVTSADPIWIAAIAGLLVIPAYAVAAKRPTFQKHIQLGIAAVSIATLVLYSWGYNPLSYRSAATEEVAFAQELRAYSASHPTPARLYSRPDLIQNASAFKHTDSISPLFAVYQPMVIELNNASCFRLPLRSNPNAVGTIQIGLHTDPLQDPIRSLKLSSVEAGLSPEQKVCFPPVPDSASNEYWLSVTSEFESGV